MRRIAASLVVIGLLITLFGPRPRPLAAQEEISAQEMNRLADALAGRRAARRPSRARGLPDVYQRAARAVPFVIAADGTGSSYVVGIQGTSALLVTNHHVVENPIRLNDDTFVLVVFYDDELAKEEFDLARVKGCHDTASAWCRAFRGAVRRATIVASDASQDIAVLMVRNVPAGVERLQHAPLNSVRTGEEVLVVGHPLNLLWTLTTGIVSGVAAELHPDPGAGESRQLGRADDDEGGPGTGSGDRPPEGRRKHQPGDPDRPGGVLRRARD
jgi:S1-C subfamily serine protease